jgi:hypothetical protein
MMFQECGEIALGKTAGAKGRDGFSATIGTAATVKSAQQVTGPKEPNDLTAPIHQQVGQSQNTVGHDVKMVLGIPLFIENLVWGQGHSLGHRAEFPRRPTVQARTDNLMADQTVIAIRPFMGQTAKVHRFGDPREWLKPLSGLPARAGGLRPI